MKTNSRRPAAVLAAVLAAALACPSLAAEEGRVRIKIGKLREEIAVQEDKLRLSGEEESAVLEELDDISSRMETQQEKILVLQKQLQSQQQTLAKTLEVLNRTVQLRDKALQHMLDRLRAFYMMGRLGVLNVTFSSRTLPELMLMTDAFRSVAGYDRTVVERYRESVAEQERAATTHELEESLLEELVRQAEEERQSMQALRSEREELLDRIKQQQGLYRLAVQEMRRAEEALKRTLARRDEQQAELPPYKGPGLKPGKGSLPMPADGRILVRFGEALKDGLRKGEVVNGIHIDVKPDSEARAVQAGRVVFAGYRRGYGNAVILDHGLNWFTMVSRLDAILVREGDDVAQNQKIGISGDISTLYEPGLYFEVRQGSTPQDPLQWLRAE